MTTTLKEKLPFVDLMKLYGKIRFSWDLQSDVVHWHGPLNKLLNTDIPLLTGTSFLNRIRPDQFWKRLQEASQTRDSHYQCTYMLLLANNEACCIEESGEIIRNAQGVPVLISGSIQAIDSKDDMGGDLSGYDGLTGYPQKEVLLETLTSLMESVKTSPTPGGYLCFSIDRLSLAYFLFGLDTLRETIKCVGKELRAHIRFNDFIGRISGCCFGIVLKETDEWGVFKSVERIQKACQKIEIQTPLGIYKPTLSAGGAVFDNALSGLAIMKQAENNLFEMQNLRGAGNYGLKPFKSMPIPEKAVLNQNVNRRFADRQVADEPSVKKKIKRS